jgi:pyroglutamyl-peptidase
MARLLVTGFTPFAGREVNASWLAATALQEALGDQLVKSLELPVEWGEPQRVLEPALAAERFSMILSLGEGKPGCFLLETLALNRRAARADNRDALPPRHKVLEDAPASLRSSAPLPPIRQELLERGVPILLSLNAGSYLCEETLFLLEHGLRNETETGLALFVHLPPYATRLVFKGRERSCDAELLKEFVLDLYQSITGCLLSAAR